MLNEETIGCCKKCKQLDIDFQECYHGEDGTYCPSWIEDTAFDPQEPPLEYQ